MIPLTCILHQTKQIAMIGSNISYNGTQSHHQTPTNLMWSVYKCALSMLKKERQDKLCPPITLNAMFT